MDTIRKHTGLAATHSMELVKLLHATDIFPQGGRLPAQPMPMPMPMPMRGGLYGFTQRLTRV